MGVVTENAVKPMSLLRVPGRVFNILLRPARTWAQIARESDSTLTLLLTYIMPLAAILPICTYVGYALHAPNNYSVPEMIISYVFAVLAVYVMAWVVWFALRMFQRPQAYDVCFRLVTYTGTAIWILGFFWLIPDLGPPAFTLGLYSAFVMHQGFVHYIKISETRSLSLTVALFALVLVLAWLSEPIKSMIVGSGIYGV